MTRHDVPPSPPSSSSPSGDVEYVRKLSLAILSTLQSKGLLGPDEVDAILIAARRAAQGAQAPGTPARSAPSQAAQPGQGSASGVTRPPSSMQVTVQPPGSLTWHTTPPGAPESAPEEGTGEEQGRGPETAEADAPAAEQPGGDPTQSPAASADTVDQDETTEEEPQGSVAGPKAGRPDEQPQPPMFDIKLD